MRKSYTTFRAWWNAPVHDPMRYGYNTDEELALLAWNAARLSLLEDMEERGELKREGGC